MQIAAHPEEFVALYLGGCYLIGLIIAYGIWRLYWRPHFYEDGGDNGKRNKRDGLEKDVTPSPQKSD